MKWGYHDWLLNKIMTFPTRKLSMFIEDFLEHRLDQETNNLLKHYKLDNEVAFFADLKWFLNNLDNAVF